jgi:cell division transport system permease protein
MAPRLDSYFKETVQGLKRNGLVAFAAISTAFIALFLVGIALLVQREVHLLIQQAEGDVSVSVFLMDTISPSQQQHLQEVIQQMPEVATVEYESKDQAYAHAKILFAQQPDIVKNVSPDAFPASFRVQLKDPKDFTVLDARLLGQAGIESIRDNAQIVNRLLDITKVFRVGMLGVAVIMLIAAAILIGNTVRLAVFNRRKEIGIMRLVGATSWHIRVPFLVEGVIEGLIGAGAAILGLFVMKVAFFDPLRTKVRFLAWVGTPDVIATIPWLVVAGVAVAIVASLFAMRRFLDV